MELREILWVVLISATPIGELRAGIPTAYFGYDFPWYYAFLFSVLGNLLPIPFILLFLDRVIAVLGRIGFLDGIIKWVFERTRRRGERISKVEGIGLALFVGVPLPVTGGWTGALIAFLRGMERKRAFLYIALGVFIAGVIVTALCVTGNQAFLWLREE
ncbi:MAG: small multi-drug export protein [Chloroflexi bacterium]|nr:small multi-drug export protein [Chloroflexota bacterium]